MQPKMWEAEAGVPKLLGIQLLLENCTEESGMKGEVSRAWDDAGARARGSQTPGHPGTTGSWGVGNRVGGPQAQDDESGVEHSGLAHW